MAKKESPQPHWMVTLLVAALPALIAGWFSVRAADKADQSKLKAEQTANELAVAYQLMKQSLELIQKQSDGYRESLQKTNELLIALLEKKTAKNAEEAALLTAAKHNMTTLRPPPEAERPPHFPPLLRDLLHSPK
jgi:hypothetical protein